MWSWIFKELHSSCVVATATHVPVLFNDPLTQTSIRLHLCFCKDKCKCLCRDGYYGLAEDSVLFDITLKSSTGIKVTSRESLWSMIRTLTWVQRSRVTALDPASVSVFLLLLRCGEKTHQIICFKRKNMQNTQCSLFRCDTAAIHCTAGFMIQSHTTCNIWRRKQTNKSIMKLFGCIKTQIWDSHFVKPFISKPFVFNHLYSVFTSSPFPYLFCSNCFLSFFLPSLNRLPFLLPFTKNII